MALEQRVHDRAGLRLSGLENDAQVEREDNHHWHTQVWTELLRDWKTACDQFTQACRAVAKDAEQWFPPWTKRLELPKALPHGLPRDGYLTLRTMSDTGVFTPGPMTEMILPSQLAMNTVQVGNGRSRFGPTTSDKFRLGQRRAIMLVLHLTSELVTTHELEEIHLTPGDSIPYDQLPEQFRKRVDQALARMRQQD